MSEGIDTPGAVSPNLPNPPIQAVPPIAPNAATPPPASFPPGLTTVFDPPLPETPAPSPLARLAPPGGRGGLWFWGGLCALLAVAALLFHSRLAKQDQANREAQEQLQLFVAENQKLRAEVDRLQTELSREGSLLRSREQILRETTDSLQVVQAQADQAAKTGEALRQQAETLRGNLDKAIPNDPDIQIVTSPKAAPGTAPQVTIRIGTGLLFDPGETILNPKGAALVKTVAAALAAEAAVKLPAALAVEAHFDSTPLKSTNAWDLSSGRAGSVVKALTDNAPALASLKIAAQGFADTRPIVPNDGPDHARNRRVEIVLTVGE